MWIYGEEWYRLLQDLRQHEVEQAVALIRSLGGQSILEIGAGAGWQAAYLSRQGFDVTAVDLASTEYRAKQIYPVTLYDGHHLPLPDASVDVVFTSNVLEHIPHVVRFQEEIHRVLKPGGYAIHFMPTTTWCFWTLILYYPFALQLVWRMITGRITRSPTPGSADSGGNTGAPDAPRRSSLLNRVLRRIIPAPHGAIGNAFQELYYFSAWRWVSLFKSTGWQVEQVVPNHLFYTGYLLTGRWLSVRARERVSRILGSACKIYIVREPEHS